METPNEEWIKTLQKRRDELEEMTFKLFRETKDLEIAEQVNERNRLRQINELPYLSLYAYHQRYVLIPLFFL